MGFIGQNVTDQGQKHDGEPHAIDYGWAFVTHPYTSESGYQRSGYIHGVRLGETRALCGKTYGDEIPGESNNYKDGRLVSVDWQDAAILKFYPDKTYCRECVKRKDQREAWEAGQRAGGRSWRERYADYLRSNKWRELRAKVLYRDGMLCQSCLIAPATEVHHLSYRYYNDGFDVAFVLRSVCADCHDRITEIEGHGK